MPLIAHTKLPAYERLAHEGYSVISPEQAIHQDIRELHVGLLNMMPDAALAATERQIFRLVGGSNRVAQFYMHPFTLPELERGEQAQAHIDEFYESFEQLKQDGLDALFITGANVTGPDLENQPFWQPLIEVIDWASDNVTSTLCSCLATHAVMQFRYGQKRRAMGFKRWGVFSHYVVDRSHPFVVDANTRFDVPHSRFNDISRQQFTDAGVRVLVASEEAGVHLAVSEDGFRTVFFQGHPEYDTISLLKEFKREINAFISGNRQDFPPFPENYFRSRCKAIIDEYREELMDCIHEGKDLPEFPESLLAKTLDNTWHDTAVSIVDNWIGLVYRLTNQDRRQPFMDGVDPDNPLGLFQE